MDTMMRFLKDHFWHVFPILAMGAFAVAIIVERVRALFFSYPLKNSERFFDKVRDLVISDRLSDAVTLCDHYRSKPAADVTREALLRAHQPESLIEHGLEIAVSEATLRIQKYTAFLATIANVATLLGLLGTIFGLIQSFAAIGNATPQEKSALLASGISTAMNATMLGLGVAIPCMIAYSFLMNRTNRLTTQVEQSAVRVLDILKQRFYGSEVHRDSGNESNIFSKSTKRAG